MKVKDVVHTLDNETYRKRKCSKCGYVLYTVEFEVECDENVTKIWCKNYRNRKEVIQ